MASFPEVCLCFFTDLEFSLTLFGFVSLTCLSTYAPDLLIPKTPQSPHPDVVLAWGAQCCMLTFVSASGMMWPKPCLCSELIKAQTIVWDVPSVLMNYSMHLDQKTGSKSFFKSYKISNKKYSRVAEVRACGVRAKPRVSLPLSISKGQSARGRHRCQTEVNVTG